MAVVGKGVASDSREFARTCPGDAALAHCRETAIIII
jgi:hypothetical protein